MLCGMNQLIERKEDGGMYFIWVPLIGDVRILIMDEAHASSNCLTCLKVNAETSKTFGFIAIARVDRLTKSAHFLAIREDYKMEKLARLYIDEIVAGHEVPVSIILDRDGRFTSRSPVLWAEIRESRLIGPELVQETTDKVILIKERFKAAKDCQNSYVDNRRKQLGFEVGDKVILEVSSWKGSGNGGVYVVVHGGECGGDMAVSGGLKGCLDHRILRSSPIVPPLQSGLWIMCVMGLMINPITIPLWVKICNVPLEACTVKGISTLASRVGKPLVMDNVTASMCRMGIGRVGFAMVLMEVNANKLLPAEI
ncbi:putative reverse transcriptase domain-containing protein [Tanacetum coccineum]